MTTSELLAIVKQHLDAAEADHRAAWAEHERRWAARANLPDSPDSLGVAEWRERLGALRALERVYMALLDCRNEVLR